MVILKSTTKIKILVVFITLLIIISLLFHQDIYHFYKNYLFTLRSSSFFPLIFIASYVLVSFLPFPFTPYSFIAGFIFPLYSAWIYTLIASTIFAFIMFYISRYLGEEYVSRWSKKDPKLRRINENIESNGLLTIFLLRLFFVVPTEIISIFAGLSKIRFRDFIIGTVLGNAFVLFFSVGVVRGKLINNEVLMWVSFIGLVICVLIPILMIPNLRNYLKEKYQLPKRD